MSVLAAKNRRPDHLFINLLFDVLLIIFSDIFFAKTQINEVYFSLLIFNLTSFQHEIAWFYIPIEIT